MRQLEGHFSSMGAKQAADEKREMSQLCESHACEHEEETETAEEDKHLTSELWTTSKLSFRSSHCSTGYFNFKVISWTVSQSWKRASNAFVSMTPGEVLKWGPCIWKWLYKRCHVHQGFGPSAKWVGVLVLVVEVVSLSVKNWLFSSATAILPRKWWTKPVPMGGFGDCVHNFTFASFGDTRFWLWENRVSPWSSMHTQTGHNLHWIQFKWELLKSVDVEG